MLTYHRRFRAINLSRNKVIDFPFGCVCVPGSLCVFLDSQTRVLVKIMLFSRFFIKLVLIVIMVFCAIH